MIIIKEYRGHIRKCLVIELNDEVEVNGITIK